MHAAQAADGPRLAEARGCLEHDLALEEASGVPPGRGLAALVSTEGHARQVKHRVEEIELKGPGPGSGLGVRVRVRVGARPKPSFEIGRRAWSALVHVGQRGAVDDVSDPVRLQVGQA
eukprot:scaffold103610_cov39-Phaeocystis_antarctica.AAC.1